MITGSVPTDNLPRKSHDVPKQERRTLVRTSVKDMPSTSTSSVSLHLPAPTDADRIKPWIEELDEETILPWKVEKCEDNVKFELYDGIHSIAKYTVIINTTLDFSIYTFHWPIPENHTIYLDKKRSMGGKDIKELLTLVENANLCENWKKSTLTRQGEYSVNARGKMFLSSQTHEGLKIAVHSHIEAIHFVLGEGFQYVLSERFMQDVLEDYFGHQRSKGGRSDNPTAQQFGYNDLTIAAQ